VRTPGPMKFAFVKPVTVFAVLGLFYNSGHTQTFTAQGGTLSGGAPGTTNQLATRTTQYADGRPGPQTTVIFSTGVVGEVSPEQAAMLPAPGTVFVPSQSVVILRRSTSNSNLLEVTTDPRLLPPEFASRRLILEYDLSGGSAKPILGPGTIFLIPPGQNLAVGYHTVDSTRAANWSELRFARALTVVGPSTGIIVTRR
jgi:hypothetical protein